jgi:hypothetical protein
MNRSPLTLLLIGASLLGAIYISSSVMMGSGNALADMFFYLMMGAGALGIVAPRLTFYLFLFECAYLDLAKRFLVFGGNVTMVDLFWVLGTAPITLVGITGGVLLRLIFGTVRGDKSDWKRFALITGLMISFALGMYVMGGGIGGTLRETANGASYAMLVFIVPLLFPRREDFVHMLRTILWIFLPVAFYAVYQQFAGFQDFEIDYLKRGLSIEIKLLEMNRVRSFSTLNSPTSVSVVAASCAAFALALWTTGRRIPKLGLPILLAMLFIGSYIIGWAASTVRVGILLMPVAYVAAKAFQTQRRTQSFYFALALCYLVLIFSADWILGQLFVFTEWALALADGNDFLEGVLNINTYSDRVKGFSNVLTNPRAYTLFGLGKNALDDPTFFSHDPVSTFLLMFGVVPLLLAIVVGALFFRVLHKNVWVIRDPATRYLAASCLANSAGNFFVTLVNGNLLTSFPVNVFFWLGIAGIIALRRSYEWYAPPADTNSSATEAVATTEPHQHERRPRMGRFAPVPLGRA